MHIFNHPFDYIALSILIACMLGAAAMVLYQRKPKPSVRDEVQPEKSKEAQR